MDFTKFVSLLETESIFLSRSDKFDDPYEGSTTQLTKMTRPARKELTLQPEGLSPRYVLKDITVESLNSIAKFNEWMRSWTYVNCWHMNPYESAAMWKLYARTDEAVAIQSTYTRLRAALPDDAYVGVVKYIDYDTDSIPEDNVFWPYVHKRKSFEHEKELC
jgi:hypothetical protein